MTLQPLIEHLGSYIPLKQTETQILEEKVTERRLKREEQIIQEGVPC